MKNLSTDAMLLFLKPPLGYLTTCGQNHIAQDTYALLDFSHEDRSQS